MTLGAFKWVKSCYAYAVMHLTTFLEIFNTFIGYLNALHQKIPIYVQSLLTSNQLAQQLHRAKDVVLRDGGVITAEIHAGECILLSIL